MEIDFGAVLTDMEGKNINVDAGGKPATLSGVCVNALMTPIPNENPNGNEKFLRYQLAQKIHGSGKLDLKIEEIAKLKELIGKLHAPLIVGRAYELLEKKKKGD